SRAAAPGSAGRSRRLIPRSPTPTSSSSSFPPGFDRGIRQRMGAVRHPVGVHLPEEDAPVPLAPAPCRLERKRLSVVVPEHRAAVGRIEPWNARFQVPLARPAGVQQLDPIAIIQFAYLRRLRVLGGLEVRLRDIE